MKKRFITLFMACAICATSFAGCGSSENSLDSSKNEIKTSSVTSATSKTDGEWSTKYDKYFENNSIPNDNVKIIINSEDGKNFMNISTVGKNSVINVEGDNSKVDIYMIDEDVYCYSMEGDKEEWVKAKFEEQGDGETNITDSYTANFDASKVKSIEYVEEVVEDNVTYDVIKTIIEGDNSDTSESSDETNTFIFYINRESQDIYKVKYSASGITLIMNIEECTEITLPDGAKDAKEISSEEIVSYIMGGIFMGLGNVIDLSSWEE